MDALKGLRRADLLEVARLAGVAQASRQSKQQLVESIFALNPFELGKDALLCLAKHLGLKNPQRASKAVLARKVSEYLRPSAPESSQDEVEAADAARIVDLAISTQLLSSSRISSELSTPPIPDVPKELGLEQLRVTQAKFSPGVHHHLLIDQEATLPDQYGIDRAVLLVRDPFWLFLYWELAGETLARAADHGFSESVIRVHDVTGLDPFGDLSRSHVDLSCGSARSWYINVEGDNRDYRVDVGCRNRAGEFQPLLRSNTVSMPPAKMSSRVDDRFMRVPFDHSLRPDAGRATPAAESGRWFTRHAPRLHLRMARLSVPGGPEAIPGGPFAVAGAAAERNQSQGGTGSEGWRISSRGGRWTSPESQSSLWFQLGPDFDLSGRADPASSVHVNGAPVPLDPFGRFHVQLTPPARSDFQPVIAHSSGPGTHEIVIQWREVDY